jgi:hypothetical protein
MNDLSEIDRRDFFSKKDFIDESHLLNDWSIDWIESDCCLFNDWKDENRFLIDSRNRCLIDWDDDDRCLIDNFSLFRDWIDDWIDRSRNDDSDFRDSNRDWAACHE